MVNLVYVLERAVRILGQASSHIASGYYDHQPSEVPNTVRNEGIHESECN